jgi:hypothetical protein
MPTPMKLRRYAANSGSRERERRQLLEQVEDYGGACMRRRPSGGSNPSDLRLVDGPRADAGAAALALVVDTAK